MAQNSVNFAVSIHVMLSALYFPEAKITSEFIASSVGTNPVVIRRIISRLKAAGLVSVRAGVGGMTVARPPEAITLWDIFSAVNEAEAPSFGIHHAQMACPLGSQIEGVLGKTFTKVDNAVKNELKSITLADILGKLK